MTETGQAYYVNPDPPSRPVIRLSDVLPQLRPRKPKPQEIVDMGCPWSGGALVLRQGPHGDFLGCADYPECDYTESVYLR